MVGGVGFPACTGKGGLASLHALGRWGWLPCMHWEGGLASQHALGRGLASQHAPELGKAGGMHPTGMLSCFY